MHTAEEFSFRDLTGSCSMHWKGTEEKYTGEMLMKCGFLVKGFWGDFKSKLYHFVKVTE